MAILMVDELLPARIEKATEKGLSRSQIRSLLLEAGWPEKLVREYLSTAKQKKDVFGKLGLTRTSQLYGDGASCRCNGCPGG